MAAAIFLLASGIVFLLYSRNASSAPVATITSAAAAQWDGSDSPVLANEDLSAGRIMGLKHGTVELKFIGGASAVVEAPASFRLESGSSLSLISGKIAATVAGGGFTVDCPHASVVDLGTKFAVAVNEDGSAGVEVFQGSVRAVPVSGSTPTGAAQVLTAGQAADISDGAVAIDPAGASLQHFVLVPAHKQTLLDLTDLVCGGDGTTSRRGASIDVRTGRSGTLPQIGDYDGDHLYHRVPLLPVVDGCFVPDGQMQVDSSGDTFAFPTTSRQSSQLIWAGGTIPPPPEKDKSQMLCNLGGVDYSTDEHGFLAMHPNKGLTFDLAAIRRLHPDARVFRFRCTVGDTSLGDPTRTWSLVILVDGKTRFEKTSFVSNGAPFNVDLPLWNTDHFLTLATLEGKRGIGFSWILFGDPVFNLTSLDGR